MSTRHTRPAPATTRTIEPGRAACAGTADWIWFPDAAHESRAAKEAKAEFCDHCPIFAACLAEAIENRVEGIWAGTTWAQRQAMRRRAGSRGRSMSYSLSEATK